MKILRRAFLSSIAALCAGLGAAQAATGPTKLKTLRTDFAWLPGDRMKITTDYELTPEGAKSYLFVRIKINEHEQSFDLQQPADLLKLFRFDLSNALTVAEIRRLGCWLGYLVENHVRIKVPVMVLPTLRSAYYAMQHRHETIASRGDGFGWVETWHQGERLTYILGYVSRQWHTVTIEQHNGTSDYHFDLRNKANRDELARFGEMFPLTRVEAAKHAELVQRVELRFDYGIES